MCGIDWQRAADVLAAAEGVVAAWIFGSAQLGRAGPASDLDIGVLFEEVPSLRQRAELRAGLQQALDFDDIDLLVLNEAGPIARFEAISGRAVWCQDRDRRAAFVSLSAREYEDEMALLRRWMVNRSTREGLSHAGQLY